MKRILFPTNLTAAAEHAFEQAAFLADQYGSELHILHVVSALQVEADDLTEDPLLGPQKGAEPMHLGAESFSTSVDGDVRLVERQVVHPSSVQAILDYATEIEADLIVMGTHGRTGMDRWLLGSVAEQVVRRAQCPVYTIRADATKLAPQVKTILVPYDFSAHAEAALKQAVELSSRYGAHVVVLHVIDQLPLPGIYGIASSCDVSSPFRRSVAAILREKVEAKTKGMPYEIILRVGDPAQEIIACARETQSDLLVIASHGQTGVRHLLLGSVTEKVVRKAPCWVLTVRRVAGALSARSPTAHRLGVLGSIA